MEVINNITKFEFFLEYLDKNKCSLTRVRNGADFESSLQQALKKSGFNQIVLSTDKDLQEKVTKIRYLVQSKKDSVLLENTFINELGPEYVDFFIVEPYGSQNYPDLMVFNENKIIMVESKFTSGKAGMPMWNSNLPKKDSFYVYGSGKLNTLTYFVGNSLLQENTRNALIDIENKIKKITDDSMLEFNHKFDQYNPAGFNIYPRLAFHQTAKGKINNLFDTEISKKMIEEAKAFRTEHNL